MGVHASDWVRGPRASPDLGQWLAATSCPPAPPPESGARENPEPAFGRLDSPLSGDLDSPGRVLAHLWVISIRWPTLSKTWIRSRSPKSRLNGRLSLLLGDLDSPGRVDSAGLRIEITQIWTERPSWAAFGRTGPAAAPRTAHRPQQGAHPSPAASRPPATPQAPLHIANAPGDCGGRGGAGPYARFACGSGAYSRRTARGGGFTRSVGST